MNFKIKFTRVLFNVVTFSFQVLKFLASDAFLTTEFLPSVSRYFLSSPLFQLMKTPNSPLNLFSSRNFEVLFTGKVENLHAHVNRNLQHANPNLHVL